MEYQGLRMSFLSAGYLDRFHALLVAGPWLGISSWLRWLSLVTAILGALHVALWAARSAGGSRVPEMPLGLGMAILWAAGTLAQALIPGTFFRHYWLALVGPCCVALALAVNWFSPRSAGVRALFSLVSLYVVFQVVDYRGQADVLRRASAEYPQAIRWEQLRSSIAMDRPVALWGGLLHFWVYAKQSSRYPNNMWWSYIQTNRGRQSVDEEMRGKFRNRPPEYFLELPETYPPDQQLVAFPLSARLLRDWTGQSYCVMSDLPAIPGRYGGRVILWQRCSQ